MAVITTRAGFIDYCLRKLGFPVIEINIDDQQIEDRVDDAFLFWQDYHYDATERSYYSHEITQDDIDNGYITLPESMIAVIRCLPMNSTRGHLMNDPGLGFTNGFNLLTGNTGAMGGNWGGNRTAHDQAGAGSDGTGPLTNAYIALQSMAGYEYMFGGETPMRFSRHTDHVHLDMNWQELAPIGNYIMVEGYKTIDPDQYTDVYNDRWLKKYATSLIKQQWGQNLIKYDQVQLPGGVMFNGRQLYDDAQLELEKLEEQIQLEYELPPMFFTG